ncbi:MAG: hypothetical protein LKI59_01610 [Bacteroidales bacterium]|jgi:predicted Fe-Mo cluster-binding NifX family protein|nr:hypothetical protein [Bacteroidales bacterium]
MINNSKDMKIAISSKTESLSGEIDSRFGRCPYFAIYDSDTQSTDFVVNKAADATDGAGPAAVGQLAAAGINEIVSGDFGMKIKDLCSQLNIQLTIIKENLTIKEITDNFKSK